MTDQVRGFIGGVVVILVAVALWFGWAQYKAGSEAHMAGIAAANVLFQQTDLEITDASGAKRRATVGEVLGLMAQERIAQAKQQADQQKAAAPVTAPSK